MRTFIVSSWLLASYFQRSNAADVAHVHDHVDKYVHEHDGSHEKKAVGAGKRESFNDHYIAYNDKAVGKGKGKVVGSHANANNNNKEVAYTYVGMGMTHSISMKKQTYAERSVTKGKSGMKVVHKSAYYGKLEVGSPRQPFTVVFDSGSGNLMIPSTYCSAKACTMHKQFHRKRSKSAKDIQADGTVISDEKAPRDQITVTFGTGEITGVFIQDNVCVGNMCEKMSLVGATDETDDPFSSFRFDGVLGLARLPMSQGPEFNLFDRLVASRKLKKPIFSVFLSDSDSEDSEITLGDIKHEHMASDMLWSPVSKDTGYWQVQIDDIAINNARTSLCEGCQVAVDTGTSQLAGPSQVIADLEHRLNVLNSCENYDRLPVLGFVLGDHILNLQPRDYVDKGPDGCEVSLMKLDVPPPNGPLFVLGDPFLRKFYTSYDRHNNRVGFAVARHAESQGDEAKALMVALNSRGPGEVHHMDSGFLKKH